MSRGRKHRRNQKSISRRRPDLIAGPGECDCPACSGEGFDPRQLIDGLLASAAEFVASEDPLEAEMLGATFLSVCELAGEGYEEALIGGFVPAFEARASAEALAMLLALGAVTEDRVAKTAQAAADRLVAAGVPQPAWAVALAEPMTVANCGRLVDRQRTASMLTCAFHRAGHSHAVMMSVDHLACGAAGEIHLLDADGLPEVLKAIRAEQDGAELLQEEVDPADLRRRFEDALDSRAVHDGVEPELDVDDGDDGPPPYRVMAVLLRTWMKALPASERPMMPHPSRGDFHNRSATLDFLAQLVQNAGGGSLGAAAVAALPAKRKRSQGPAPVYQIKVGLRGAKPPIWRRLEVPADVSLAGLHTMIQVAFDWDGGHLHVFDTPYGQFGTADGELGHRAEAPVTLEQVAPGAQSKIRYIYDFGDDWEHDILVEKVFGQDTAVRYPRCTGGRRAAPPDDCGGIWGYANLMETLADPGHPEHEDMLEWLGFEDATEFDPNEFDANDVTVALSHLR